MNNMAEYFVDTQAFRFIMDSKSFDREPVEYQMGINEYRNRVFKSFGALCLIFTAMGLLGCGNRDAEFIEDRIGLLNPPQRQRMEAFHQALWQDLGIRLYLVILDAPADDLLQTSVDIFDRRLDGEKTAAERGLLFLVDPAMKRVRLEVGYGLESVFTDAFVSYVEREQMAPFFAEGRVGDGVEATVELLVSKAHGHVELQALQGSARDSGHGSGGAGAEVPVSFSRHPLLPEPDISDEYVPRETPMESLRVYMKVLERRVKDPNLLIYTRETRRFLSKWLVTDAQQEKELKGLSLHLSSAEQRISGDLAVVRFPVSVRTEPPYFFRKSSDGWRLDISSMNRLIRFNHLNQWRFTTSDHEFMFAFSENSIDANGFIH